ncbi:MAG: hypothetical protein P1U68_17305, partial [Verrucomicrobiales bacterium]|nr:hypothetical protein [Verrucomicrobiales bacterium]
GFGVGFEMEGRVVGIDGLVVGFDGFGVGFEMEGRAFEIDDLEGSRELVIGLRLEILEPPPERESPPPPNPRANISVTGIPANNKTETPKIRFFFISLPMCIVAEI